MQVLAEIFMYLKMLEVYLPCTDIVWLGVGQSHWLKFARLKELVTSYPNFVGQSSRLQGYVAIFTLVFTPFTTDVAVTLKLKYLGDALIFTPLS